MEDVGAVLVGIVGKGAVLKGGVQENLPVQKRGRVPHLGCVS